MYFWQSSYEILSPCTLYIIAFVVFVICKLVENYMHQVKKQQLESECCFRPDEEISYSLDDIVLSEKDNSLVNKICGYYWEKEKPQIVSLLKDDAENYIHRVLKTKIFLNLLEFHFGVIQLGDAPKIEDIEIKVKNNTLLFTLSIITKSNNCVDFRVGNYNGYINNIQLSGRFNALLTLSKNTRFLLESIRINCSQAPTLTFDYFILRKNILKSRVMKITKNLIAKHLVHPNEIEINLEHISYDSSDGEYFIVNEDNEYLLLFETIVKNLNKLEKFLAVNSTAESDATEDIDEVLEDILK